MPIPTTVSSAHAVPWLLELTMSDLSTNQAVIPSTSIAHLFDHLDRQDVSLSSLVIHSNGVPIIITSMPEAYAYDRTTGDWGIIASSRWIAQGVIDTDGPVGQVLQAIQGQASARNGGSGDDTKRAIKSLEIGLYAARLLDSDVEYRTYLGRYIDLISQSGLKERAEGLLRDIGQRCQR